MDYVYIIVENGKPYPNGYTNYKLALKAVKEKHREYLEDQIKELHHLDLIENVLNDINVVENIKTGVSMLYIEKGINIEIHKVSIKYN
jgi:hypothetical protein